MVGNAKHMKRTPLGYGFMCRVIYCDLFRKIFNLFLLFTCLYKYNAYIYIITTKQTEIWKILDTQNQHKKASQLTD